MQQPCLADGLKVEENTVVLVGFGRKVTSPPTSITHVLPLSQLFVCRSSFACCSNQLHTPCCLFVCRIHLGQVVNCYDVLTRVIVLLNALTCTGWAWVRNAAPESNQNPRGRASLPRSWNSHGCNDVVLECLRLQQP